MFAPLRDEKRRFFPRPGAADRAFVSKHCLVGIGLMCACRQARLRKFPPILTLFCPRRFARTVDSL